MYSGLIYEVLSYFLKIDGIVGLNLKGFLRLMALVGPHEVNF